MKKLKIKVENKTGIHARPASHLVKLASEFIADVVIIKDDKEINAKSILGVMSLGVSKGEEVIIKVDGDDEDKAIESIKELFNTNFGE